MSERTPRCWAQRLVAIALPSVLRERSKSTQQRTQRSNSGLRREIAVELVARYAPLMRSRLPRPDANNSIASAMREAPPVNATMPSALRVSVTSSAGTCRMNQRNPSPTSSTTDAHSTSVDQPSRRSHGLGEMQHFVIRTIGRHGGAGGERGREHGGVEDEHEIADAEGNDRSGHGAP